MNTEQGVDKFPMEIKRARLDDAREMVALKYENLMARDRTGEIEMTAAQRELAAVTEEKVSSLEATLSESDEDSYYLVGKEKSAIVGFCQMTWRPDVQQYQFRQFYVRPGLQGGGRGDVLLKAAIDRARHSHHAPKGIFLLTGLYNKRAQSFYERRGFVRLNESHHIPVGDRDIQWIKMQLNF